MAEFWEEAFKDKKEMWGSEPAKSTILTNDFFIEKKLQKMFGGVKIFFYDKETIEEEFGEFGLFETTEVIENYPFHLIKCTKKK